MVAPLAPHFAKILFLQFFQNLPKFKFKFYRTSCSGLRKHFGLCHIVLYSYGWLVYVSCQIWVNTNIVRADGGFRRMMFPQTLCSNHVFEHGNGWPIPCSTWGLLARIVWLLLLRLTAVYAFAFALVMTQALLFPHVVPRASLQLGSLYPLV